MTSACATPAKAAPWLVPYKGAPLGHILMYYDGSQPLYSHLRASMLACALVHLLSMLSRFASNEVDQIVTDSIYVAMKKLQGVEAFVAKKECGCGGGGGHLPSLFARRCVPSFGRSSPMVTRAKSSACPRNKRPTLPSLTTKQLKRSSLPTTRNTNTTRCRDTA